MEARNIIDNWKVKKCIFVIILLLLCNCGYGQATTQGKDFWISFGSNAVEPYSAVFLQVRIVATNAANVRFTFTETGDTETISLAAGSVYTRDLSETEKDAVYADWIGTSQKSLHIESDENIAVYAINLLQYTTDATGILPVNAYDTSYFHLSYDYIPGAYDGYVVVAIEDNTNIYDNNVLVATLDRGEVFSNYFEYDNVRHITANKPIAYFTTNQCVRVSPNVTACDCLYEQLSPESLWGVSFMVPVTKRGIERIRIYAAQDNTIITHSGGTVKSGSLNLNSNEYVELEINLNEAGCYIESNRPVAVVSFLTGLDYPNLDYYNGDPAMAWVPSIDQYVKETTIAPFIASGSSILEEHHILIVTSTKDKDSTKISIGNSDYSSLSGGYWKDHPSGYSFYSMPLTNADLSYSFKNPAGLAILGYGLGSYESYYYLAGSALRKLDASFYVNDIHNQDLEGQAFCADSAVVKAVVHYIMHPDEGRLRWLIDNVEETDLEDNMEWRKNLSNGIHEISMIVKKENGLLDTVRSSFIIEVMDIEIADTVICQWEKVELKIKNALDELTYSWFYDADYTDTIVKASSLETNVLSTDTIFFIEATSSNGCVSRGSVTVAINPLPELVVKDTAVCFNSIATPFVTSSDAVAFGWYSDINYTDIIVNAASFVTGVLKSDTVFYVETISDKGCVSHDSVTVAINPLPELVVKDTAICFNSIATPLVTSSDAVAFGWYRDINYTDIIVNAASFTTGVLKSDTIFYIETISNKECVSRDSVMVAINPLPELVVKDTAICFNSIATPLVTSFDAVAFGWYSDINYTNIIASATSFETSVLKSDTVFYIETVSNKGCASRGNITVAINPLPELVAKDTAVCFNSIATPFVTSSDAVAFGWYKDINYTDIIVNVASFETGVLKSDTVFYVKTISDKGCVSQKSIEIGINPLPRLTKGEVPDLCIGSFVELTVSSPDDITYAWYGDHLYSNTISRNAAWLTGALEIDTVFYIEATSNKNCKTRDSIRLTLVARPMVVAMDDRFICYGDEVNLEILQSDGVVRWNVDTETVSPTSTQEYVVTASRPPCPDAKDTVRVTVGDSLYILPSNLAMYKLDVDYSQQLTTNAEAPVFSIVNSSLPYGFSLSSTGTISGISISGDNNEFVSFFTVQVEDMSGCKIEKEYLLKKEIFIPKIFTPNGDGINDWFMKGHKVVIFDRLGIVIFEGDDGWDGTYNGKIASSDIYFYKIEHQDENGNTVVQTGYIGVNGSELYTK
jgi:gliding motility-associated-like protein